jgi:phage gpG-like protein
VRITLEIFGTVALDRRLVRVAENAQDLSPAWHAVADVLDELAEVNFSTEGGLVGGWDPLSPSTERRKSGMSTILADTGVMRDSMTEPSAENAIRRVMADGLDWGTSDPKASFHERGTKNMPRRQLMPLVREEDKRRVVSVLHDHLFAGD